MEKLAPFHILNPYFLHSPQTHMPPRSHSLNSISLGISDTHLSSTNQFSSPKVSPSFNPLNELSEKRTVNSVRKLHTQMFKMSKGDNLSLTTIDGNMIRYYLEFGDSVSAIKVFFVGFARNYHLWKSFLEEFRSFGGDPYEILKVFKELYSKGVDFDSNALTVVLKICLDLRDLWVGLEIHACLIKKGFHDNVHLSCALINLYEKCWSIDRASQVFYETPHQEDFLWNTIIMANLRSERWKSAFELFCSMQSASVKATTGTINKLLQACGNLGALNEGKQIHGHALKFGLVSNTLVDMYVKNDCLDKAQAVFNHIKNKNVYAWNSLIAGYSFQGLFSDAEKLLNQMEEEGIKPDLVTWNGLISGYSMWGRIEEALVIVDRIKSLGYTPNVVSWNSLISGCSQNEKYMDALQIFTQMQAENLEPNTTTVCSLLRACAGGGPFLLKKGEEIHCFSMKHGFVDHIYTATALIDMYSKAGKLNAASNVFSKIQEKTLPCWTCMMMGYAIHGHGEEVMILYYNMCKSGITPNAITFTALLSGCKNSGLVDEGLKYFDIMQKDYDIIPKIEQYCCMVDLLGKSGFLEEAWDFIETMPVKPDASIWRALLASCKTHQNIKLAEIAAKNLFKLEPYNSANYVLMMNIYSSLNRWGDVERLRDTMSALGIKSPHVWSWTQFRVMYLILVVYVRTLMMLRERRFC